jgi:hypothetical protein
MKRALLVLLGIVVLASPAAAQKASTIVGKTFKGVVVSSNEATREITIGYTDTAKNTTETFVGVLKKGYLVRLRDGTQRELLLSEVKPGLRSVLFIKRRASRSPGKSEAQRDH